MADVLYPVEVQYLQILITLFCCMYSVIRLFARFVRDDDSDLFPWTGASRFSCDPLSLFAIVCMIVIFIIINAFIRRVACIVGRSV